MKDCAGKDDDNVMSVECQAKLDKWHHALAQVSGTMVMGFSRGLNSTAARAMIEQLRVVADTMEKDLFPT